MNIELVRILSTLAVAAIGVGGVYLANRFQKGTRENRIIDQLQEEMRSMRNRMDRFEARDKAYIPHILRLNMHIEQGLGPPAPPIPKVILDYLNDD